MKNDIKKNGSGYYDPTAFKAIINTGLVWAAVTILE